MDYARASLCAAALPDDTIMIVGGYVINNNRKDLITYVECYNIRNDRFVGCIYYQSRYLNAAVNVLSLFGLILAGPWRRPEDRALLLHV